LPRSFAQERKSTPLLSCACALFVKNTGEGVGGRAPKISSLYAHLRVPSRHSTTSLQHGILRNGLQILDCHARRNQ
jgi:hypothetical protein